MARDEGDEAIRGGEEDGAIEPQAAEEAQQVGFALGVGARGDLERPPDERE